ncbi:hypothetical protein EV356DRAFT_521182 [Viridothelium virens]|uniref:NADH-ubiquinone oxidoreductase 17.8 kDa subunit n=1 Tax=Viridothelium virens TaxID=1048519 RepID=A0A6A6GUC0_VIRVR|nr:hypothetical protein EV356DRAFT_521182 [Viridothelium virens]
MQTIRSSAVRSTRRLSLRPHQQCRRYAEQQSSSQHADPNHGNEHFSRGFYITLAAVPISYFVFQFTNSDPNQSAWPTRMLEKYSEWQQLWVERNDRHVKMMEQAAFDRNLFLNSKPTKHVELKYPEQMNQASPWNVPAGHGTNIDAMIEHYQKKNYEENEKKLQALRDGTLKAEQPLTRSRGVEDNPPKLP